MGPTFPCSGAAAELFCQQERSVSQPSRGCNYQMSIGTHCPGKRIKSTFRVLTKVSFAVIQTPLVQSASGPRSLLEAKERCPRSLLLEKFPGSLTHWASQVSRQARTPRKGDSGSKPRPGCSRRVLVSAQLVLKIEAPGDPATPPSSCARGGAAAYSAPANRAATPPALRAHGPTKESPEVCRTSPRSRRAILKETVDFLALSNERAGVICWKNKGHGPSWWRRSFSHGRFFPTYSAREPEPPSRHVSASSLVLRDASSLSSRPARSLGSLPGAHCASPPSCACLSSLQEGPPQPWTACWSSRARSPLVPRGPPWSLRPELLLPKALRGVARDATSSGPGLRVPPQPPPARLLLIHDAHLTHIIPNENWTPHNSWQGPATNFHRFLTYEVEHIVKPPGREAPFKFGDPCSLLHNSTPPKEQGLPLLES